jgi:hypothetical protein
MSRQTAFDAYLTTDKDFQDAMAAHPEVPKYLMKAPPQRLRQLAAIDPATIDVDALEELIRIVHSYPAAGKALGLPHPAELDFIALRPSENVRAFVQKLAEGPPHVVRARSKIDESQATVKSWFDDWKDHSTGILDVHKGILDGSLGSGGDIFGALARETIALYATAFHWMLRPYTKKK